MKKLIALAALVCGTAHAGYINGNEIHKWNEDSGTSNLSWGMMYGYIAGVADSGSGTNHCSPANVQLKQIVDMVTSHISANPSLRHYSGDIIISYVLKQAWPCAKKGTAL